MNFNIAELVTETEGGLYPAAQTSIEVEMRAEQLGVEVFYRRPDEIFLDLDTPYVAGVPRALPFFTGPLSVILDQDALDIQDILVTKSRSGNMHVYLRVRQRCLLSCWPESDQSWIDYVNTYNQERSAWFNDAAALGIALLCGSDPKRYALGMTTLLLYGPESGAHDVLFEVPEEAERVRAWRGEAK